MKLIKKFNKSEKYTRYSIIVIVLFSLIVLSLASIYHVSGDGCWHIPIGKFMANNFKFPLLEPLGRDEPFWSPPLYHLAVAMVYYIFNALSHNAANFAVKLISPVFGILSLAFSFLIIKKLVNPKIAFYSTIFLAFIPIFMDYSILSYVESMLVFFVVLSIYFAINHKYTLAGVAAGLSILTKYNGIFILPVLLYILHKNSVNKKIFCKNAFIMIVLALLIASPWLIRNYALLGNPIWPFLNAIFHGYELQSYSSLNFRNLINPNAAAFTYLGIFGVPDGNYNAISFVKIPHAKFLFAAWLAGTFMFALPLIIGFLNRNKQKGIFAIWIFSYILLFLIYIANVGFSVSRIILPAFPALAVFWAFGYEKLENMKFIRKLASVIMLFTIIGMVSTEIIKINLAANAWNFYKNDFEWVKSNTNKDAVFVANGQCVPYNIERASLFAANDSLDKAGYIWVNQNFMLDKRSILDAETIKLLQSEKYKVIYSNNSTGTKIYSKIY